MAEATRTDSTSEFAEGVSVTQAVKGNGLTLTITVRNASDGILHWGLSQRPGGAWERPPQKYWPQGTTPFDGNAVRTPFAGDGRREVAIHVDSPSP